MDLQFQTHTCMLVYDLRSLVVDFLFDIKHLIHFNADLILLHFEWIIIHNTRIVRRVSLFHIIQKIISKLNNFQISEYSNSDVPNYRMAELSASLWLQFDNYNTTNRAAKRKHYSMLVISASQKSSLMSLHWQLRGSMYKLAYRFQLG